ncbi:MAG: hypothetical protein Q3998_00590 [Porphyromonas sp.]|nr:hypothetical protein [Porphyromonas sp.]
MKRSEGIYRAIVLLSGLFFFLFLISWSPPKRLRVISYNVENLFDTISSNSYSDSSFSPNGDYRWNTAKYHRKLSNISSVISRINEWEYPAIIALSEVENRTVVEDLLHRINHDTDGSPYFNFDITSGKDARGINVAVAWNRRLFRKIERHEITNYASTDSGLFPGRHSLYLALETLFSYSIDDLTKQKDTLHIYAIHLPSRRGGVRETEQKRVMAAKNIRSHLDSLLLQKPKAKVIIMGDANEDPSDPAALILSESLTHLCKDFSKQGIYSHYFQGKGWTPDHIIVSSSLEKNNGQRLFLNTPEAKVYSPAFVRDKRYEGMARPFRFLSGGFYTGGYSDHFAIYIDLEYGSRINISAQ